MDGVNDPTCARIRFRARWAICGLPHSQRYQARSVFRAMERLLLRVVEDEEISRLWALTSPMISMLCSIGPRRWRSREDERTRAFAISPRDERTQAFSDLAESSDA